MMKTQIDKSEISQRIKDLIFELDLNNSSFATSIGFSSTAINKTINGETNPSLKMLEKICRTYPSLNRIWLFDGQGNMFINNEPHRVEKSKPNDYLMEQLSALEKGWKENIADKDRTIQETQQMVVQQKFIIETLMSQLNTALGKLNLSEEILPESETIVLPFPNMKIVANNTLHTASLTVGK